jgi:3-dehydroquinate synthase
MPGDFKRLGVSRNEPVLIVGGGVMDTGGPSPALWPQHAVRHAVHPIDVDAGPSPTDARTVLATKNLPAPITRCCV